MSSAQSLKLGVYEHFKSVEGNRMYYFVTGVVTDNMSGRTRVIYELMYVPKKDKPPEIRTVEQFTEEVEWVEGGFGPRFRYIGKFEDIA